MAPEPEHKIYVFHEGEGPKPSQGGEDVSANEDGLISVGEPQPSGAQVGSRLDEPPGPPVAFQAETKRAGHAALSVNDVENLCTPVGRQGGVGVEKAEDTPLGPGCTCVALRRPAALNHEDLGCVACGYGHGGVAAATVHHKALLNPCGPQALKAGLERRLLAQGRDYDGDIYPFHCLDICLRLLVVIPFGPSHGSFYHKTSIRRDYSGRRPSPSKLLERELRAAYGALDITDWPRASKRT